MSLLSKFIKLNWQFTTGISTTVIAICALSISIWQGIQTRNHNILSVKPYLTISTSKSAEKGFYKIELKNNGIGPAIIKKFLVKVDGNVISGQEEEPIQKAADIIFPKVIASFDYCYVAKGYVIAPKDTVIILDVNSIYLPTAREALDRADNRIGFEIYYNSFYGKLFRCEFPTQRGKAF